MREYFVVGSDGGGGGGGGGGGVSTVDLLPFMLLFDPYHCWLIFCPIISVINLSPNY